MVRLHPVINTLYRSHAVGNNHRGQATALKEGTISDGCNAVRNCYRSQVATARKSQSIDGCHAVRDDGTITPIYQDIISSIYNSIAVLS